MAATPPWWGSRLVHHQHLVQSQLSQSCANIVVVFGSAVWCWDPCYDQMLQSAGFLLWHLWGEQVRLRRQVSGLSARPLLRSQEESGLRLQGSRWDDLLTLNVQAVLWTFWTKLCASPASVWIDGRRPVQHSVDSGLQALHEQPEGGVRLWGRGEGRAVKPQQPSPSWTAQLKAWRPPPASSQTGSGRPELFHQICSRYIWTEVWLWGS